MKVSHPQPLPPPPSAVLQRVPCFLCVPNYYFLRPTLLPPSCNFAPLPDPALKPPGSWLPQPPVLLGLQASGSQPCGLAPRALDSCHGNPSFLSGSCLLAPVLGSAPPIVFPPSVSGPAEFLPTFFPSSSCTRGSTWLLGGAWSLQGEKGQERDLHDFNVWFLLPTASLPLLLSASHPSNKCSFEHPLCASHRECTKHITVSPH